jgi:DNA polymerase-3 subunit delta
LIAAAGNSLRRLSNEITKLSTAAMPATVVTEEMVDELVPQAGQLNHFALTDHLVAGRGREALAVSKRILDDGAEPLAILGMLSSNFRRLVMVKELMSEGVDRAEVARVLKLRYYDQEKFMAAARRTPLERLREAIEQLAAVDVSIKTSVGGGGKEGPRMLIELLICRLAAAGARSGL